MISTENRGRVIGIQRLGNYTINGVMHERDKLELYLVCDDFGKNEGYGSRPLVFWDNGKKCYPSFDVSKLKHVSGCKSIEEFFDTYVNAEIYVYFNKGTDVGIIRLADDDDDADHAF